MSFHLSFPGLSLLIISLAFLSPAHAEISETLAEAVALTPDSGAGITIYPLCAACHGENSFAKQQGEYPFIAGRYQRVVLTIAGYPVQKTHQSDDVYIFRRGNPGRIAGRGKYCGIYDFPAAQPVPRNGIRHTA